MPIVMRIAYEVFEPKKRRHILRQNGYGDNFASGRRHGLHPLTSETAAAGSAP